METFKGKIANGKTIEFQQGFSYSCKHLPTKEEWYIIGIDPSGDRVCAAGYPASIAKLTECEDFHVVAQLTQDEIQYRRNKFGINWR